MKPQERGKRFEEYVAKTTNGRRTPGSGNRPTSILDINSGLLVIECKSTLAESFRVTEKILDDIARQALGPSAGSMATGALAIEVGVRQRHLLLVDYEEALSWLRRPPELLPATSNERLRATARRPSLLRD